MKIVMNIEFDSLEEAQEFLGQRRKSTEIPQITPKTVEKRAVNFPEPSRELPGEKRAVNFPEPSRELPGEKPAATSDWPFPPEEDPLVNVCPGDPAIGKIGATAKDLILSELRAGRQLHQKYAEHLKLLWARGEVKYDGTLYRI